MRFGRVHCSTSIHGKLRLFARLFLGGVVVNFKSDVAQSEFLTRTFSVQDATDKFESVLVFVGSSVVFSDRLLQLVKSEIAGVEVVHLAHLSQLDRLDPLMRSAVSLVIVDETSAPLPAELMAAARQMETGIQMVLAYRSVEKARELFLVGQNSAMQSSIRFLSMNVDIEAWIATLRLLVLGEAFVPSEILSGQFMQPQRPPPKTPCQRDTSESIARPAVTSTRQYPQLERLTARERQIIALIARGNKNRTIANELGLSVHTVKLHVHNIFGKLGVDNRTSATSMYLSQNPLP